MPIEVGSLVYMEVPRMPHPNLSTKLRGKYIGPFRVLTLHRPTCLLVPMTQPLAKPRRCHLNKLRIFRKAYVPVDNSDLRSAWHNLPEHSDEEVQDGDSSDENEQEETTYLAPNEQPDESATPDQQQCGGSSTTKALPGGRAPSNSN